MKNNKTTLLDELRQEKEIVRQECADNETRIAEHWLYFSENASSLLVGSAVSGIINWLGFGGNKKEKVQHEEEETESTSLVHTAWNGLMTYYPVIWEIAQPLIWRFAVNKIKSLFSGKKKKKKHRYDDDDD